MEAESNADPRYAAIDEALVVWRQGDCVVGEQWFAHRVEPSLPLTDAGRAAAEAGVDLAEESVVGFVVTTQTCDVVRSCVERSYIEVSPLVEVDADKLVDIEKARRPGYAFIPQLASRRLVADLDRTMTLEKPAVAKWERTPGWTTDAEGREFAVALARKRKRFAFPDDFTALASKLLNRLAGKHDKESVEGRALRALREVRVHAAPSWDDAAMTLTFWFVRGEQEVNFEGQSWSTLVEAWLKFLPAGKRFVEVHGQVTTLEDLTAADYVGSDPLDLDNLSAARSI